MRWKNKKWNRKRNISWNHLFSNFLSIHHFVIQLHSNIPPIFFDVFFRFHFPFSFTWSILSYAKFHVQIINIQNIRMIYQFIRSSRVIFVVDPFILYIRSTLLTFNITISSCLYPFVSIPFHLLLFPDQFSFEFDLYLLLLLLHSVFILFN